MQPPTLLRKPKLILLGAALSVASAVSAAQPEGIAAEQVSEPKAFQEAGTPVPDPPEATAEPAAGEAAPSQGTGPDGTPTGAANPPVDAQPQAAPTPAPAAPLVGDAAAGGAKAALCAGCHGPDGNAPNPMWPKLAGQRPGYIAKQLRDFKAGRRTDPMMSAMAVALSEQDVLDVAAHFASLEIRILAAAPAQNELAERLYLLGRPTERILACVACHGLNGEGFSSATLGGFPAIGGQNSAYVSKQLQSFRAGARTNDWEGVMRLVSENLTDADIAALAAYLSSMPRKPGAVPPPQRLPGAAASAGGG